MDFVTGYKQGATLADDVTATNTVNQQKVAEAKLQMQYQPQLYADAATQSTQKTTKGNLDIQKEGILIDESKIKLQNLIKSTADKEEVTKGVKSYLADPINKDKKGWEMAADLAKVVGNTSGDPDEVSKLMNASYRDRELYFRGLKESQTYVEGVMDQTMLQVKGIKTKADMDNLMKSVADNPDASAVPLVKAMQKDAETMDPLAFSKKWGDATTSPLGATKENLQRMRLEEAARHTRVSEARMAAAAERGAKAQERAVTHEQNNMVAQSIRGYNSALGELNSEIREIDFQRKLNKDLPLPEKTEGSLWWKGDNPEYVKEKAKRELLDQRYDEKVEEQESLKKRRNLQLGKLTGEEASTAKLETKIADADREISTTADLPKENKPAKTGEVGTQDNPHTPKTATEKDALPAGAYYIGPDGKLAQRAEVKKPYSSVPGEVSMRFKSQSGPAWDKEGKQIVKPGEK
jgi:hypothetical protein